MDTLILITCLLFKAAGNPTSCFPLSLCLYTDLMITQQSKRDPIGANKYRPIFFNDTLCQRLVMQDLSPG